MEIDREKWLTAVEETRSVPQENEDALTMREFGQLIGRRRTRAQVYMKRLIETGLAVQVTKVIRDVKGQRQAVPAYRLVEKTNADI